jgi:hypothetical protein
MESTKMENVQKVDGCTRNLKEILLGWAVHADGGYCKAHHQLPTFCSFKS